MDDQSNIELKILSNYLNNGELPDYIFDNEYCFYTDNKEIIKQIYDGIILDLKINKIS